MDKKQKEKTMKLFVTDRKEDAKCGGCNWETSVFYGLGKSRKEARGDFEKSGGYGLGLCGDCMCGLISDLKYGIEVKK